MSCRFIIAVATINHNDEPRRIALHLYLDADGACRWYEAENRADTEVSGSSVDAAKDAAARAWSGREWNISFED